ncbi:hypothetical protein [Aquimarina agarilytica]|uniref:hypothetical protein n=1 Tax=Aquimarina agarilytica TaxID=1087449 RepID=UPI0012FCCE13|nr:hypothetical protein [Aquimarina agarilytica]
MPKQIFSIDYIFNHFNKNDQMIAYIHEHPQLYAELITASLSLSHKQAWRCAMLLGHMMKKNDVSLLKYVDRYIECLSKIKNHDGHQRQLLIILDKMRLNEVQEGKLFDSCMTIWEDIKKIPSTRIRAFWMLLKISDNYPELKEELLHFTTDYYTNTLSPGIKVSFTREVRAKLS